ncbi:2-C-methyl-D-erythritol 4-phosphate cytidylyltransferase [Citricoccus sp. SGAir0253]|uniref:IspD/TarI family cytidylyltransferase n=1 Tax=Citricoccus sp. SGAir0253 TaxID=2567881 RepID=UPI0010CCB5C6|nr:2-C-methyl-D-erythritol 4-phosphate cytidylyltransferase [Citricoccus sp. SGAir0253]QCU78814.1 2-C-methyl-D-erythritol 4-phosphate cytidylyltransferase [Citricoccus sp. SGAir0253]
MRSTLLIVAAGSGSRLRAGLHKALVALADGRTMLEHCLDSVLAARGDGALDLAGIVVVVPADPAAAEPLERVCRDVARRTGTMILTVPGGAERADSVRAGLDAVRGLAGADADGAGERHAVLVHDAARPFVPPAVFRAVLSALEAGAAAVVPGLPVVDTIKTVAAAAPAGDAAPDLASSPAAPEWVTGTPSRTALRAVQTPQGFDLAALQAAHRAVDGPGATAPADRDAAALTDDAMVMEAAGHAVLVVPGDPLGFKITTPLDLVLANALLPDRRPDADEESP